MKKWKRLVPLGLVLVAALLNMVSRIWQKFSDFYVDNIFPLWVETYGRITGLFPFSVGEWMLYIGVLLVFFLAAGGVVFLCIRCILPEGIKKRCRNCLKKYAWFCCYVFGIVCVIMTLNCFLLYQVSPIAERYQIGEGSGRNFGVEEVTLLRDYVVEQANALAPVFDRDESGYIICGIDMKEEARAAMRQLSDEFDNLKGYYPRPKGLALSGFYSQQYIMGYYFPFSMEANYNRQMYITNMPVTMCHELSHLKGFILEDEANFIGYLACVSSEEALFRYSAYLSVIGYLDRDFIKAIGEDEEVYRRHPQISWQVAADKKFLTDETWEKVEERAVLPTETVKQATDAFLDTTLTLNGVEDGVVSYSRVVNLLLCYYDGKLW